jgi:hypothetical protein
MKRFLHIACIVPFFAAQQSFSETHTITISPDKMPKVMAFFHKHGKLPTSQELDQSQDYEQAKFCNAVGSCTTGFVTTIITGNMEPVLSALVKAICPFISRSKSTAEPICVAFSQPIDCDEVSVKTTSNCTG